MTITADQRREICRRAGMARARQFTREYQQQTRARQPREMCAAKGRKGFAALVEKHGFDGALEHLAQWRRDHPSKLDMLLMAWLDAQMLTYQREVRVAGVYVDYLLDDGTTVIEVDGKGWHTNIALHGQDRVSRDAIHTMALEANGYRVFRLPERDIRNGSAFQRLEKEL